MESESNIPLLSALTEKLPSTAPKGSPGKIYKAENGVELIGHPMYKSEEMAVQRVFLPSGTVFPQHLHKEKEWLICYHGAIEFTINGDTTIMECGSCRYIPADMKHRVKSIEDSWVLAITIPASQEFPDV